jgi:hypothetical protein
MNPPLFAYEEEKKGFRAPARYYKENQERPQRQNSEHSARSSSPTLVGEDERPAREKKDGDKEKRRDQDGKEQGDDPNLVRGPPRRTSYAHPRTRSSGRRTTRTIRRTGLRATRSSSPPNSASSRRQMSPLHSISLRPC